MIVLESRSAGLISTVRMPAPVCHALDDAARRDLRPVTNYALKITIDAVEPPRGPAGRRRHRR